MNIDWHLLFLKYPEVGHIPSGDENTANQRSQYGKTRLNIKKTLFYGCQLSQFL
jgi:hypothetical protein